MFDYVSMQLRLIIKRIYRPQYMIYSNILTFSHIAYHQMYIHTFSKMSIFASSSVFSLISSYHRCKMSLRSFGVRSRHKMNASWAAWIASWVSTLPISGTSAITSPVDGLNTASKKSLSHTVKSMHMPSPWPSLLVHCALDISRVFSSRVSYGVSFVHAKSGGSLTIVTISVCIIMLYITAIYRESILCFNCD